MNTQETMHPKQQEALARKPKIQKPKPMLVNSIIDQLKARGYKTKITHYRYFGERLLRNSDIRILVKAGKIMSGDSKLFSSVISNNGGATEVFIQKEGFEGSAKTECSVKDAFKYRVGALIALKQVLEVLPEQELKDLAGTINF